MVIMDLKMQNLIIFKTFHRRYESLQEGPRRFNFLNRQIGCIASASRLGCSNHDSELRTPFAALLLREAARLLATPIAAE